ncbi:MAG: TFIIB-type zinc ribbon-containing protein [Myxococcaceae bacterium]
MRHCPACRKVLGAFATEGLELDGCAGCGGVWFDGGELARVASLERVQEIVSAASGVEGECRECRSPVAKAQVCGQCGRPAPRCPQCDRGPLAIAQVGSVRLDVCRHCSGVWFDAGELLALVGAGPSVEAIQAAASQAVAKPAPEASRVPCTGCSLSLRASSALMSSGRPYCLKCAPSGARVMPRSAGKGAGQKETGLMGKLGSLFR